MVARLLNVILVEVVPVSASHHHLLLITDDDPVALVLDLEIVAIEVAGVVIARVLGRVILVVVAVARRDVVTIHRKEDAVIIPETEVEAETILLASVMMMARHQGEWMMRVKVGYALIT